MTLHTICSDINFVEMCRNNFSFIYYFKFARATPCISQNVYLRNLHFTLRILMLGWLINWLWWGETMSLNCGHQRAYCSYPGDMWAWRAMVMMMMMMMTTGDWLVRQSSPAVLPAETSGESRGNGRRSENFAYQYVKYLKGSLTCRNISGFTSHPKEGVLRIFIADKNQSPLPGLTCDPWVQWQAL
jgi:hypothetical protein